MLDEDSDVVRLGHDFVFFEKDSNREKLPAERMDEYRRLFGKLNLENGVHRPRPGVITLIASSNDGVFSKSEKSYVHSETALSPQVDSLDQVAEANNGDHPPVYKELANDWYLFYERW
jgi:hypothetical protein